MRETESKEVEGLLQVNEGYVHILIFEAGSLYDTVGDERIRFGSVACTEAGLRVREEPGVLRPLLHATGEQ